MELRVALTDDDLKAFAAYQYRQFPAIRRVSRIVVLSFAFALNIVTVAVILVVVAMTGGTPRPIGWDLTIPISGLTIFGYLLFLWHIKKNRWRVLAKQPGIFDEWAMEIHAEAFRERSRQIDVFRRWDWFTSIERDGGHTYLTVGEQPAAILPDRVFPSARDAQRVYEEMRGYWDAARRDASTADEVGQARSRAEETAP